jgi:EAL domain-containing protein (putative c-di-GMP-specific phosphodiesterase class I)
MFFNLDAFRQKVNRIMRSRSTKNKNKAIIVFSTASLETSFNAFKNDAMTELNFEVAMFLKDLFDNPKSEYANKKFVYGFNRGIFLIFTLEAEEEKVKQLVGVIHTKVFDIVKEKGLKIWAQPFFGCRDIARGDNIVNSIEDAFNARNAGESNFESFTKFIPKMTNQESTSFLKELQDALNNNEFVPFYQPKYSLKKKEIVSAEVLARWQSPTRGLLTPGAFIDKAEQFGLISAIDIYIFEAALKDLSNSIKRGRRVIPVSTNFSLYEFFSHSFLDTIVDLLQKYQVPPSLVEIEITETTSQVNQFLSVSVIKKLKDKGIRVLMDDYGVGYSQIDNLKNIPFDAIKIDKSFTDQLLEDEKTRSIVKFLTELGHVNDMEVIIEGVEKKEQVDILRKMGVDTIQGFYYSKAMSFKDYEEFLKNNQFEGGKK